MNVFKAILTDLRDKRLWPIAALLLVAVVAVPVVLSKSGSSTPTPVAQLPSGGSGGATAAGLPAVSVSSTPSEGKLTGKGRNPFAQFKASTTTSGTTGSTTAATTTGSNASSTAGSSGSSGSSGSGGTSAGSGSGSTGTSTTPSITNPTPPPAPTGLTSTESYEVSLAVTNDSGGLVTYSPLERLSVIPSRQKPLLVELGVVKGGKRVLFAVQPGTVVSGPGACIPGGVDCEILSLAAGQTEGVGSQTSGENHLFAVTQITAAKHGSVAAANQARRATSADGRALIAQSTSSALSLFPFEPSIGALADLRNLTVGG